MSKQCVVLVTAFALYVVMSCEAIAHDSRPILIEIQESQALVTVNIKTPSSLDAADMPALILPRFCHVLSSTPVNRAPRANMLSVRWVCNTPLSGQSLSLMYPANNPSLSSLVKIQLQDGVNHSRLLGPSQTEWQLPLAETAPRIIWEYAVMGTLHILVGLDHLLFVACLLLLAKSFKRSILTITGFTLGHSVTLVAASLGYLSVPVALFEALIGLSIVFLVYEIINKDDRSWTFQYPMLVSVLFGLIHGLGFASVLTEIGLPQAQLFWGLAAFNLGIEIGQILFVALLVLLARGFQYLCNQYSNADVLQQKVASSFLYSIACLSAFWFWERAFGFIILEWV